MVYRAIVLLTISVFVLVIVSAVVTAAAGLCVVVLLMTSCHVITTVTFGAGVKVMRSCVGRDVQ